MKIVKDMIFYDEFIVIDKENTPVVGLTNENFTTKLYDPDKNEVSNITGGISINFEELGDGLYRLSFIPDKIGNWILTVYNSNYFPYGKGANYQCEEYDIEDMVKRILGLSQENFRIFNPQYDNRNNLIESTIKIYPSNTDVENDTNEIAEYIINSTYDNKGRMTGYKVKKQ